MAAVLGEHRVHIGAKYADRIPVGALIELWERAVAVTGRRELPALATSYPEPDERSLLALLVSNQPKLGDGIDRLQRYHPTVSDAYRWAIVDVGSELRVVLSPTGPVHRFGWQCHTEFESLDMVRGAARLTAGAARPLALRFLHAAPAADVVDAYASLTGVIPEFGRTQTEIVFPASVRELAIATARPALAGVIENQLDTMLDAIERGAPVSARARAAIGDLLARGTLGVDELAQAVALSRRSLERALEGEGTSAATLIEDERKQRALAWLPVLSVDEVSARLGYSDARAFARAFKRWTGLAPSQTRPTGGRR